MQSYTNLFNVAVNRDGSEVILNFFQNMPEPQSISAQNSDTPGIPTETVSVANLVMTGQCARNLLTVLQDILGKTADPKPE